MNARQQRFIAEYLKDLNATQAAIRAGYSAQTAHSQGERLLRHVEISQELTKVQSSRLKRAQISADRVLAELAALATVDARSFFDHDGNLKPLHTLTPEQGAALAGFEVVKKNLAAGDGKVDTVHKIKLWDKPRALELLAKHLKLLTEHVQIDVSVNLVDRLQAARSRAQVIDVMPTELKLPEAKSA